MNGRNRHRCYRAHLGLARKALANALTQDQVTRAHVETYAAAIGMTAGVHGYALEENERELRTLLVSDIEQFTSTVSRLGDERGHEFIQAHNRILRLVLKQHHGAEVTHTGDGLIASFVNASRALHCASAIQRAIEAHNIERPDLAMRIRVGLHAGEPVAEDNRLFGTCVNTAVRVCTAAAGAEVLVSDSVIELVSPRWFAFTKRGPAFLKGLPEPVELYELDWRVCPGELN